MDEQRLDPPEYLAELRALREVITATTSRAEALQLEEKPDELAGDLQIHELVEFLEEAEQRALEGVRAAEILLATKGFPLDT
ncbi:MAG: hypothetical protein M3346_10925 [Actinomycetota bacterium]|nr:hypothetical protein [Actinomycetota bacterium]